MESETGFAPVNIRFADESLDYLSIPTSRAYFSPKQPSIRQQVHVNNPKCL